MKTLAVIAVVLLLLSACQKHIHVPTPTPTNSGRSVVLTWTASTTPGVSYNAYRATSTCAQATTGTKLNSTPITALTYTDPDVPVGTLCYWTTAFLTASATQESVPSNKAEVTIITQPNPPQNLQVTPTAVTMQTGTTQLFRANLDGTTWSISPPDIGVISSTGLYTAPASIKGNNIQVQVIARSGAQTATADITLRKN
jgi:hypothetical protein